jgi:hypothetical protein
MATGVAGQEVDVVRSDIMLDLEITNWEFFTFVVSVGVHSCGNAPCQRAMGVNNQPLIGENGHPVYVNALKSETILQEQDFVNPSVATPTDIAIIPYSIRDDLVLDGHVVVSTILTYRCFNDDGTVIEYLAAECQGITPAPSAPSMVAFMLDRRPPNVEFSAGQIETINNTANTCNINNEVINPAVSDETSTVALSEVVDTQAGCSLDRTFRAIDSCGNGVEYVWSQFSPPN